jgi:YD repeat-containing protein
MQWQFGNITQITDPIEGTISYTRNLRGDLLTNVDGSYTRDLLGRATAFSYTAGGSDTATYTPEGYVSSFNNLSYTRNSIGQLTNWNNTMYGNGSASFAYVGSGSTALGLVGTMSGSGHVGSHLYQYDSKNWLSSFSDTSKNPSPSFGYTYSSAKELTYLNYPGNIQMHQLWNAKNITSQTYTNTQTQTTYSSISQSYTNDKLTGYTYNIKAGMTNFSDTVTPSYVSTGAMKEKLDTLTYSGSGRIINYGYDANHGRLNSLKYSDVHPTSPFALNYDGAGRLSSIVNPWSQTVSTYSYDPDNQGLLSGITYAGNKTATFAWNAKKQLFQYTFTDQSTQPPTTKAWELTYYDDGRVATHTYSLNDTYQYEWKYYYSPYGIEKAQKYNSGQLLITIDATTAPNGRMVSMNYQDHTCQIDCFAGEASAIYDPCGNLISLVAQTTGVEVWARAVDKNSNATIGIYDPFNMEIPFSAQATINPSYDQPINGPIEFQIPEQRQWALKELLANQTKVNTTLGEMGIDVTIGGDDDCTEDECDQCDMLLSDWIKSYNNMKSWQKAYEKYQEDGGFWIPNGRINPFSPLTPQELTREDKAQEFFEDIFGEDFEDWFYQDKIDQYGEETLDICRKMIAEDCDNVPEYCTQLM